MFNQNQLEEMGFEFTLREFNGAKMFAWNFTIGASKQPTPLMRKPLHVRESRTAFPTLQAAIYDAIVEGNNFSLAQCGNCDHVCDVTDLNVIKGYSERVQEGEDEPLGECPKCGALSHGFALLPNFDDVIQYFGLDTSFQYDSERIVKYSADYVQAVKQTKSTEESNVKHHEMVGYEKAINDVVDRLAQLIVRAEEHALHASTNLGTMCQVGANASLADFKTAFLVAIGQGKSPAGELTMIQALEKARGTQNVPKPTQPSGAEYGIIRSVQLKAFTKDDGELWTSIWNWLGTNSQSRRMTQDGAHSNFEFLVSLEHPYYDAPLTLNQLIEDARSNNVSYLRFYG